MGNKVEQELQRDRVERKLQFLFQQELQRGQGGTGTTWGTKCNRNYIGKKWNRNYRGNKVGPKLYRPRLLFFFRPQQLFRRPTASPQSLAPSFFSPTTVHKNFHNN